MKLNILNIDKFIQKNNCKEVKNAKVNPKGFDPESLWSESIFGPVGSRTRRTQFGYIQLRSNIIHPIIFDMLKVCSEQTSRIINKKTTYIVSNKVYVEDPSGETGISFLIKTLDDIDLQLMAKKEKLDSASFIESNKKQILIDKFIVIPASYRDIDLSKKDAMQMQSEVNVIYKDILYINNQLSGDLYLDEILIEKLQYNLNKLITWFQYQLKGKKGVLRGNMLKKRMDYTSRLVCVTNQEIPLGYIGIPWHTTLAIFEPLFTFYCYKKDPVILDDIKAFLKKDELDFNDFLKFIQDFTAIPQIVPPDLQQKLSAIASKIIEDQSVMFKRDPVTHRNSWSAAHPIITTGRVVQVNALDLEPLQGDSILGNVIVYEFINNKYVPKVIDISEFNKYYDCKFSHSTKKENGKEYYYYDVLDDVFSYGLNEFGEITFSRILSWHIHKNIKMYNLAVPLVTDSYIVGNNNSLLVLDHSSNIIKKISTEEFYSNKINFSLYQLLLDENLIPTNEIRIHNGIDVLVDEFNDSTIAYDFTLNNPSGSFLHESGLISPNCDGDTICIVPLFSDEAKHEATEKLNPRYSKSKYSDVQNNNRIIFEFALDILATIFKATRDV